MEHEWLSGPPPARLETGELTLRRWEQSDVDSLFQAVSSSGSHLTTWFPWAVEYDRDDATAFISEIEAAWSDRTYFAWAVRRSGQLVGSCGLQPVDHGVMEISYWTHVDAVRQGIARRAAAALTRTAFALGGVEAVEIRHADTNRASARIPEVLGFAAVGTEPRPADAGGDTDTTVVWRLDRNRLPLERIHGGRHADGVQVRVGGVCIADGRALLQCPEGDDLWFVPGGRVQTNESAEEALVRELREELGIDATPRRLCAVIENAFETDGAPVREVGLYYVVDHVEVAEVPSEFVDDGTRLRCHWIPLGELGEFDVRPPPVVDVLQRAGAGFVHTVAGQRPQP